MRKLTYLSTLTLIFILPWEDSITIASLGSIARLMGLAVASLWIITIVTEGRFRKPNLFHAFVTLFFLWNFLSVYWSLDVEATIQRIKTYSQILLLIFIFWDVFQTHEELMAGLQAYVLGAYILVISTIYNYLAGNVIAKYEGRYSATGVNAVDAALILILGLPIGLPFAMQLFFSARKNLKGTLLQILNLLYIPISIFSIVLTGSRTSLVAIIPFVLLMIGTPRIKATQKIFINAILLVSLLALYPYVPQSVIYRLGTIGTSIKQADLGGRVNLWQAGIMALAQHPMLGVGSGAMDYMIGAWVHNTFISIAAETGFIGFVLFLLILGLVLYNIFRLPKLRSELWLTIFMTWVIGVLSLSWEIRKITWIMLCFMVIESSFREQASEQGDDIGFSKSFRRSIEQENMHPKRA